MQPTPAGSHHNSDGGGGELSRGSGLARFRSAPPTWLETLLEDEEEDPLKPNQSLTQLLAGNSTALGSRNSFPFGNSANPGLFEAGSSAGCIRQNSSPAEFLGSSGIGSEGFLSNFGGSANYEFPSPGIDGRPGPKRAREAEDGQFPAKFSVQPKRELTGQLSGGISSLIDMDMDKLLEDSVPCRVRAKRGCATHPRSIAERVRRTRISDRIRKLQELVPNMDKQTNTANMLEEAVEYVKFLQSQIQELSEHQRRCKCTAKN